MRHGLMATVAALALAASAQVASAQSTGPNVPGGPASPAQNSPSAAPPSAAPGAPTGRTPDTQAIPEKQAPGPATQDRGARQDQRTSDDKAAPQQRSTQGAPQDRGDRDGRGDTKRQTDSTKEPGAKQNSAERPMRSSNVSLTTEQRTTIRNTVINTGPRVSQVNFSINVGTVVPRTVRVAPLPAAIVEIQPDWRGYMYFIHDDEIIVVEPGTLRIVAVLEV